MERQAGNGQLEWVLVALIARAFANIFNSLDLHPQLLDEHIFHRFPDGVQVRYP